MAAIAWVSPLVAQESSQQAPGNSLPKQLDLSSLPGALVEDIFVPVPSEIFGVLDKLGDPDWRGELPEEGYGTYPDRTRLALVFGLAVADGFLAVEAEDREAIKRIGREILRLATAIGIQSAVTPHVQSILEASNRADWGAILQELDRTQATVRETMEEMRDDDLARCVSIGGWLRGTQVASSLISDSYSQDKAELLSQPDIVRHFSGTILHMDPSIQENETMVVLSVGLGKIGKIMAASGDVIGADDVAEIHELCSNLLDSVRSAKPGKEKP
ncbi:MAG: hypothetical protein ACC661_01955 [Verrucomicrobiales bacterium]